MKERLIVALLVGMSLPSVAQTARSVIRKTTDLTRIAIRDQKPGATFELDCRVLTDTASNIWDFCVEDASGATILRQMQKTPETEVRAGDRIRAKGTILTSPYGHVCAQCKTIEVLSHDAPRTPISITGAEFLSGKGDCRPVCITGTVIDLFLDDIDRQYTHLILNCDGCILYAPCWNLGTPDRILGATVRATGIVHPRTSGARRHIGRTLMIPDRNALSVIRQADDDPFKSAVLKATELASPAEIQSLGRRRTSGSVLARWRPRTVLLKTPDGPLVKCDIANQAVPDIGQHIDITGIVDTDLFHLTLCRASWRPAERISPEQDDPEPVSASALIGEGTGIEIPDPALLGRPVRLCGTVRSLPTPDNAADIILVENAGHLVPIDISYNTNACVGLSVGCLVEITGICLFDTDLWRQNAVFPRVRGYRLVTRTPQDIVLLKQPPWWTPGRLFAAIGFLLALLTGILVWNLILRRLVEAKGHEIAEGKVARAAATAKIQERTRLAVELHDSVAQNLTGVSLEIRAARRAEKENPSRMSQHLNLATRSLDSCREELRNCLWDLRNQSLDETTVDEALRKTLQQHVGDRKLSLRFNVPREKFSDNTTHTILCVVRELVINAIRHGCADEIKVAGSVDGDRLLFSVRDNGCGFDPQSVSGMKEGHFGLQGIRDRIGSYNGEMSVESSSGCGTKVTITMSLETKT